MSISKTRQKLIDIARQLFAKNGVANTTMNDIAVASGKGRRTLYTYFNSKEVVYSAVIESELERLSDKLDEVAAMKMRPLDKVIELIYTHLIMIRETVVRNGNLRAEFFRNIWMVEKVRKKFDDYEIDLFRKVYQEGKADGEFDIDDVNLVADITCQLLGLLLAACLAQTKIEDLFQMVCTEFLRVSHALHLACPSSFI